MWNFEKIPELSLDITETIGKTIGPPAKSSLSRIFSTVVLSTFRLIVNDIANGFKSVKFPTVKVRRFVAVNDRLII